MTQIFSNNPIKIAGRNKVFTALQKNSKVIVAENLNHAISVENGMEIGTEDYIKSMDLRNPMIFRSFEDAKETLVNRTVKSNSNNGRGHSDETDAFNSLQSGGTIAVKSQNIDGKAYLFFYEYAFKEMFGFAGIIDTASKRLDEGKRLFGRNVKKNPLDAVIIPGINTLSNEPVLKIFKQSSAISNAE